MTDDRLPPLPEQRALDAAAALHGQSPARKPSKLVLFLVGGIASVLVIGGVIIAVVTMSGPTALERAAEKCTSEDALEGYTDGFEDDEDFKQKIMDAAREHIVGAAVAEDDGKTLIVRTEPADDDPLGMSSVALECVQNKLNVPEWLQESIASTRALDGRQTGEWDGYSAQWGYHPDNGLHLIIVQK